MLYLQGCVCTYCRLHSIEFFLQQKATVLVSDWLPAIINKSTEAEVICHATVTHSLVHFLDDLGLL